MADTAAALVIQLSADFNTFKQQMQKATGIFDTEGRKIAKKQADLKKQLSDWTLDFSGLKGFSGALAGLTAVGIGAGLADIVKKSLDAASAIGDTAQQAGVSVEKLQELRFAASQSGATFDIMDTALTTLNKTFGDFVNTGAGKGAATFKQLGITKLINSGDVRTTEQLFDVLVKKISGFGSEAQKSALLASVFGKEAGPKLLQLVNQGSGGIADLEAKAVSLGIVLSKDTVEGAKAANDKLDALFSVMKAQGVAAVASLAPEIASLAQQITDGLPDLILWVERWADWFGLIKLSPVDKLKAQISDIQADIASADGLKNSFWTNPLGLMSMNIDAKKGQLQQKLKGLQGDLAKTQGDSRIGDSDPIVAKKLHVAETPEEKAQAAKRKELLAQTGVDAATAAAALSVAQDQTNVQLLKGSADYYAAVNKQINDEYAAKVTTAEAEAAKQKATLAKQGTDWKGYATGVANINSALTDKIAAAAEEQKQKLDEAGPGAFIREALISGQQAIQQYGDETAAIGLVAGAAAKLAYVQGQLNDARQKGIPITDDLKKALDAEGDAVGKAAQASHDASVKLQDSIQVTDELRTGLEDVGVAGLHGFNSLKDAANSFLSTLGDTIVRLYVMKPLIESMLGAQGTSGPGGGGILSSIGSLFGFANGGVMTSSGPRALKRFAGGGTSNSAAIFGEAGPEAAVPLPDGRSIPVKIKVPSIQNNASRQPAPVYQSYDLRGAVMTDDLLKQMDQISKKNANEAGARSYSAALKAQPARAASNRALGT